MCTLQEWGANITDSPVPGFREYKLVAPPFHFTLANLVSALSGFLSSAGNLYIRFGPLSG